MDTSSLVTIVVGLIILAVVWKLVAGAIRLIVTIGVIAVIAYVLLNFLR